MDSIDLKYGRTTIPFEFEPELFTVLRPASDTRALDDADIGSILDRPIGSPVLEEIVQTGETVLLVVPDATRQTGCGQIVNLLVRRLIANGTPAHDIRIIFATGIHRKVTAAERDAILTPFIAQRIKTLDHDPRDLGQLITLGESSRGTPIELNRALVEHDRVILVGGVTFHYFAGFTGGRKLVCPGLGSTRTISETHKLAFDCETHDRRAGVDTGLLDGNAVNEAFMEIVEKIDPAFSINTIVDDAGAITEMYCGDWRLAHRAACDAYAKKRNLLLAEKRDIVIASCGGFPYDINLIQAHKAADAAARACNDGGTIILLAECEDGLGRSDFLKWFEAGSSVELADTLCRKYQVNGQTAWSLLRKAERFDLRIMTSLDDETLRMLRSKRTTPSGLQSLNESRRTGYILPDGAKLNITIEN